jgi:phosphoribosyl 1,2-cyclic phosphodiesterase
LRFCILASGSTGNATIVANDDVCLLVDAGLSAKKLEQLMHERHVEGRELQAILVTHEHSDHIKGLGALARKYKLPIYANSNTWNGMEKQLGDIEDHQRRVMQTGEVVEFGSIRVESYAISHDAAEPVGYCFYENDMKLSLATDLGYVSSKVKDKILDSDVLVIESNHDVEMLRMGRYPWNVKRRILGDTGHLSNEAAGDALCELVTDRTKRVYLAHLSRDHNMLDLARLTVHNILEEQGITNRLKRLQLMDTFYDRPTRWDRLHSE